MHMGLAITNACNAVKWVTRFSCDIFGFVVPHIYYYMSTHMDPASTSPSSISKKGYKC